MGGSVSSRDIIAVLEENGWRLIGVAGDHHHFKHPRNPGKVTVPHPRKDVKLGTVKSIERQSGLRLR